MKLFMQAAMGSIAIHVIYFVGILLIGYIKTMNYTPDIEGTWESVGTLQNKVAFGMTGSPFFFLFTFIGVTLFCEMVIVFYRKVKRAQG
jgi:quinol-cytochrome oxidoreductase complex cytochrome b subunit